MAIDLSNIIFTDQDDIFPVSGVEQIFNSSIANTYGGNDTIIGTGSLDLNDPSSNYGILNYGTVVTAEGSDVIIGTAGFDGFINYGTFNTGEGDDVITGEAYTSGIIIQEGIFDTGDGNDRITGISNNTNYVSYGISNHSTSVNTGDGNDTIDGRGFYGLVNNGLINTGTGKDTIITKGIHHENGGNLYNFFTIYTGEDDDIINGIGGIYNEGVISMGNGNDSIIANAGFNNNGSVFLGKGEDYIKGFGSGNFHGENDNDILELTSGSYRVERSESGVNFINSNNIIMKTFEFEKLIVNNTTYDFASLSNGQTISVVLL